MQKRLVNIIIILVILLSSCEKPIVFTEEIKEPKLVINSFFNPDSTWTIYLSHSLTVIDQGELDPVDNATVKLFENEEFIANLDLAANGKYVSAMKPLENKKYRIEAEAPGYKKVSSISNVPKESIQVLSIDTSRVNFFDEEYLKFKIEVNDVGEELHYYGIRLFGFNEGYLSPVYFRSADPVLNVGSDYVESATFTNELFTNSVTTIELSADVLMYDGSGFIFDRIILVIETFSEEAYLYNRSYEAYQTAIDDFFAQPVQVFSNIENGFGIFGGFRTLEYPLDLQ